MTKDFKENKEKIIDEPLMTHKISDRLLALDNDKFKPFAPFLEKIRENRDEGLDSSGKKKKKWWEKCLEFDTIWPYVDDTRHPLTNF